MTRRERARELRADPNVHYNCAQAVLMPFAADIGITDEQAFKLALDFNAGMGHGYVCGAISGALMAMGGLGLVQEKRRDLMKDFLEKNGCVECARLLKAAAERGEQRKAHCDALVYQCVDFVCREAGLE